MECRLLETAYVTDEAPLDVEYHECSLVWLSICRRFLYHLFANSMMYRKC